MIVQTWPELVVLMAVIRKGRFKDTSLKVYSAVESNRNGKRTGQLVVFQGTFAYTFKLEAAGLPPKALRVFQSKPKADQEQRFKAISKFIQSAQKPYFANFKYYSDLILIENSGYPALVMDWVPGLTLRAFLDKNLNNISTIEMFRKQWVEFATDIDNSGCVHGDLHEKNIIIDKSIRLVDYDGMFTPDMVGLSQHEIGNDDYQHPLRSKAPFGTRFDRFSSILIWLSLSAAIYDNKKFTELYNKNDNGLILTKRDFLDPDSSSVILALSQITQLKEYVVQFSQICKNDVIGVPSLTNFIANCKKNTLHSDVHLQRLKEIAQIKRRISGKSTKFINYPAAKKHFFADKVGRIALVSGCLSTMIGVLATVNHYWLSKHEYGSKLNVPSPPAVAPNAGNPSVIPGWQTELQRDSVQLFSQVSHPAISSVKIVCDQENNLKIYLGLNDQSTRRLSLNVRYLGKSTSFSVWLVDDNRIAEKSLEVFYTALKGGAILGKGKSEIEIDNVSGKFFRVNIPTFSSEQNKYISRCESSGKSQVSPAAPVSKQSVNIPEKLPQSAEVESKRISQCQDKIQELDRVVSVGERNYTNTINMPRESDEHKEWIMICKAVRERNSVFEQIVSFYKNCPDNIIRGFSSQQALKIFKITRDQLKKC